MHPNKRVILVVMAMSVLGLWELGRRRGAAQAPAVGFRLEVPVGSTVPLRMSNRQLIKAVRSENPAVATVSVKVDDPKTALVKGEKEGFTRVTLTDNADNDEVYEIFVGLNLEQKRQLFLTMARKAVPTAIVDVLPTGATTIVTGTVGNPETVQVIMEIARGLFPGTGIINGMTVAGVQQIQLDVVVAVVNRTEARNMGFHFLQVGQQHFLGSSLASASNLGTSAGTTPLFYGGTLATGIPAATSALSALPNVVWGVANQSEGFTNFLSALRSENLIKILAEPRVTTLSGRPAYFVDGGEVPVVTSSSGGSNVSYKPFGTTINFLPVVLGNGRIHLEVQPQISTPNQALTLTVGGISPVVAPGFDTRGARVSVLMEDGQTLVIGGLIQNKVLASTNKIPCLGDLPFCGFFFRSVSYREEEEELVILVTPHLVDPLSCWQVPPRLPGQETRSPDDFELFLEGILEAPRGPRTVCCPGYTPAFMNAPMPGSIPGPTAPPAATGMNGPANLPIPGPVNGYPVNGYPVNGYPVNGYPESAPSPRLIQPTPISDLEENLGPLVPEPVPGGPDAALHPLFTAPGGATALEQSR